MWILLWLLQTSSTLPGHYAECPGALAITLQMWNWSCGCNIFVPPSEVLKKIAWMQDGLWDLWVLEVVKDWRSRYQTNCLWMEFWFQTLESQGFFLGFTPFYSTKIYISNSEIAAFFSWEMVCCALVGDLGRRKEESDSFKISNDTKC